MPPYPVLLLTAAVGIVGSNSLVLSPIAGAVAISFDGSRRGRRGRRRRRLRASRRRSARWRSPRRPTASARRARCGSRWRSWSSGSLLSARSRRTSRRWRVAQALAGLAAGAALPACYGLAVQIAPPGRGEPHARRRAGRLDAVPRRGGQRLGHRRRARCTGRAVFALLAAGGLGVALAVRRNAGLDPAWRRRDERGGTPEVVPEAASSEADPGAGATLARRAAGSEPVANTPLAALRVPGILPALGVCGAFMTAFYGVYAYLGARTSRARSGARRRAPGSRRSPTASGFGLAVRLDGLIDRHGREPRRPAGVRGHRDGLRPAGTGRGELPARSSRCAGSGAWRTTSG